MCSNGDALDVFIAGWIGIQKERCIAGRGDEIDVSV